DSAVAAALDQTAAGDGDASQVPDDVVGWQQYRARVEGGFMRFFRAPDAERWVVQSKDGTRFDFGILPSAEGPSDAVRGSTNSVEVDPELSTRVYRWMLSRMSDTHGSTVYYECAVDGSQSYLSDIFYVSRATCAASNPTATRQCP